MTGQVRRAVMSFGRVWDAERATADPVVPAAPTVEPQARGALVPLGINPATGKRFYGTGRYPRPPGLTAHTLDPSAPVERVNLEGRFIPRRERANALIERMRAFSAIYNAGYMVRDAYFGPSKRQREAVMRFIAVLLQELRGTDDYEAVLFAVADTLYASSLGVPWEH